MILLIILINLLFYWRTLQYEGICDDIPVFNKDVQIPKGRFNFFWAHLHGHKYVSWKLAHCQTLGLHTINCILIYIAFHNPWVALLFAVNPVNNQCSIWVSGKGYSQSTMCALLMWIFPYYSIIPYLYATYFCGPAALLFPLMFLFTPYKWLALLVLLGIYREHSYIFSKKEDSKFNTESNDELKIIKLRKIIVALKSLGYYFVNTIITLRLGFYHKYLFLHGVSKETNKYSYRIDKYFFIGIALVLTTVYTRNIGLIWFCLTIAQWCNVISFNQTITNRYIYLPNIGLTLFVSSLLLLYTPLAYMLFVYYAVLLIKFHIFYKSEYWSIEYACFEQPEFFYPWQNRAVHCFQNVNYHGALNNMIKCNELRPNDWKITYNLCQIYMLLGNLQACKDWYKKAQECTIDGREEQIKKLMERLGKWIESVENQAKTNDNKVNLDIRKFDLQR